MFVLKLLLLSIIGGFIGWITNFIAVRLLFKPLKPIHLFFGIKIQGVIPARKTELANSIGKVIEQQLISPGEIFDYFVSDKEIDNLKAIIVTNVVQILKDKLPGFLHGFTDRMVKKQLDTFMEKDGDRYIRTMLEKTITNATEKISISQMVVEKIEALDLTSFEAIVSGIVKKELRHIEYFGAVLGFAIGILQGLILLFIIPS